MDIPSTAAVADACVRLGLGVRVAGAGPASPSLRPSRAALGLRLCGPVVPACHAGSVDVFFEALREAPRGAVLCVDNGGRLDEGCVGDLTALEARGRGAIAMAVWGCHRDSVDLARMEFPVWSLGSCPAGPARLEARAPDALTRATLGVSGAGPGRPVTASREDSIILDDDGAVLVATARLPEVLHMAHGIAATERRQAELAQMGRLLSTQLDLDGYLAARAKQPSLTFREHLRARGGAIEE